VSDALAIQIAGGECEYTRHGFGDLFVGQCVDIAQPSAYVAAFPSG
jgi:D-galactarolactone cycloisomerase